MHKIVFPARLINLLVLWICVARLNHKPTHKEGHYDCCDRKHRWWWWRERERGEKKRMWEYTHDKNILIRPPVCVIVKNYLTFEWFICLCFMNDFTHSSYLITVTNVIITKNICRTCSIFLIVFPKSCCALFTKCCTRLQNLTRCSAAVLLCTKTY